MSNHHHRSFKFFTVRIFMQISIPKWVLFLQLKNLFTYLAKKIFSYDAPLSLRSNNFGLVHNHYHWLSFFVCTHLDMKYVLAYKFRLRSVEAMNKNSSSFTTNKNMNENANCWTYFYCANVNSNWCAALAILCQ